MENDYMADDDVDVDDNNNNSSSNGCYFWSTHGQSYMSRNKRLTVRPNIQSDLFYIEIVPQDILLSVKNNGHDAMTAGKGEKKKEKQTIVYVTIATEHRQRQGFDSTIRRRNSSNSSTDSSTFPNENNASCDNGRRNNKNYLSCGEPSRINDSCPCTYNRSGIISNREIFQMIYCEDDGTYIFKSWNGYYLHYYESTNSIAFTRCKLQINGLPPEKGRW
eukprot:CAMPEP_0203698670 /NCGR_PEP_ID=MMETSP0091-20130426/22580_1 /ASSEMBLY_ACC=CAM_ASM_001089 /TAXON_ID=426623 /ORGANISM="Chaetoceros affinis, Strain CCMP159" /LENGTH=218 /DNA_ID=CAMNT_0050571153 /DNA_START=51 /DNA_END=704 /DNA_ORIENTATION=+